MHALGEQERAAIRAARRVARERAWALGARPATVTLDFDAQLLECHTEKESGGPHRKGGFGFHPLHCFLDETGEHLAGLLRPGNAGANTAADHITVLEQALAQLPERGRRPRTRRAGAAARAGRRGRRDARLRRRRCGSAGSASRSATTSMSGSGRRRWRCRSRRWRPALDADGQEEREGAWVAELTDQLDLSGWPEGTRLIVRKEIPHPGAQLRFTDLDGHRFQCFLTDEPDEDIAALEARHRLHARVEDRIQESQELGLGRLPFQAIEPNQAWFELALLAQDLLAWLGCSCSRANSRARNRSGSATASSTSPAASPAPAAAAPSTSPPPGPGATSSPPPSTRVTALAPG